MKHVARSLVLVGMLVAGCGSVDPTALEAGLPDLPGEGPASADATPSGWGLVRGEGKVKGGGGKTNGISYHGGPVMLGTTDVYFIWYGDWSGNTAPSILTDLIQGLSGSHYFNINTTYTDASGKKASNSVRYAGSTSDAYSRGSDLADGDIFAVVNSALTDGVLPTSAHAVYFVLTSADVSTRTGFCTQYCGWHTHASMNGQDIKYAFVGNADRCPSACAAQATSPNDNAGADAMASIVAHELDEAVTDPDINAWYDSRGMENADKCAWTFGSTYAAANGSLANMKLDGRDFLIQQNWVNAKGGYCAKSL